MLKEMEELGLDDAARVKLAAAIQGPVAELIEAFKRPEEGGPSGEPKEGESSSEASGSSEDDEVSA